VAKVLVCRSQIKPQLTEVASSKGDGTTYTVIGSTFFNDYVCECKGYEMRGECRHVREVDEARCTFEWEKADENMPIGKVGDCPECNEPLIVYELEPEFDA